MSGKPLLQAEEQVEEGKKDEDKFAIARTAGAVAFFCEFNDQMMGVFLAPYFMNHGVDQAQVGACFFLLACGFLIGFPISRVLLSRHPPNRVQFYAAFGFIAVRLLFGLMQWVPDDMLLKCALALCLFAGSVASVIESAGGAWVMESSKPEDRTEAQGVLISTRVSGSVVAPFIGGTLYSFGGFFVTFFVGAIAFLAYLIYKKDVLLSYERKKQQEASQSGSILKHKLCLAIMILNFTITTLFLSGMPWFTAFFHFNYHCSIFLIGILMSSLVIPFIITTLMLPKLQKWFGYWQPVYMALLLGAFGYLFMGPSPLVAWFLPKPSPSSVWIPILSCYSGGIMLGTIATLLVPLMVNAAIVFGFDEQEASSQASSLAVMQAGVGIGVGPMISGQIVHRFGVPIWTTTLCGIYLFLVIPLVYWIQTLDSKQPKSATQERRPSSVKA